MDTSLYRTLSVEWIMGALPEKRLKEVRVKAGRQLKGGSAAPGELTEENLIIQYMSKGGQALKILNHRISRT